LGYQAFDKRIRIAGVILNQLGGARHESKLRAVIEHYTDVSVLGAIGHDPRLGVVERHLGLMPNHELDDAAIRVRAMGDLIAAQVDLAKVRDIAASAPVMPECRASRTEPLPRARLRIGVARDKAFGFYYPDDLQALERAGAEIVPINTLADQGLPALDGLFIGGGFPEEFMPQLEANVALRHDIGAAIEAGLPVYAECGGLMYLARKLSWKDRSYQMVGALPADVMMHERPVGRGYVELELTSDAPWSTSQTPSSNGLRGHEFHYSSLENLGSDLKFAYRVKRGYGVDGQRDGLVYRNVLASYSHLRSGAGSDWARQFIDFVQRKKIPTVAHDAPTTHTVLVNGCPVGTDVEGYLKNTEEWTEDFALAQAAAENLPLTDAHWQVITYLRAYFQEHQVQAQVRAMIWHFAKAWGPERGNNHYLHELFPIGGPQKQGNRLAGLLKTKGEH
jgi:cobyrinic acid a,c-diamide synthase